MSKGTILLLTDRSLEGTIVENFLRTKGYEIQNISTTYTASPAVAVDAEIAILVLDEPRSNLIEACSELRQLAHRPQLPIIVIRPKDLGERVQNVRLLVRPIRLFELADIVAEHLVEQRGNEATTQIGQKKNRQDSVNQIFNYSGRLVQ